MYYQQLPGTNGGPESRYDAAYPFGAGLSYTSYRTDAVRLNHGSVRAGEPVGVSVTVTDTGGRGGDLVVPVYVSRPVSQVLAPSRKLVAFARVTLGPARPARAG